MLEDRRLKTQPELVIISISILACRVNCP